jgi:hypothetical protein
MKHSEAMADSDNSPPEAPKLEPGAQNMLGRELRHMYHQIVSEPVPDRFVRLLDQLEQAEGSRSDEAESGSSSQTQTTKTDR